MGFIGGNLIFCNRRKNVRLNNNKETGKTFSFSKGPPASLSLEEGVPFSSECSASEGIRESCHFEQHFPYGHSLCRNSVRLSAVSMFIASLCAVIKTKLLNESFFIYSEGKIHSHAIFYIVVYLELETAFVFTKRNALEQF